MYFQHHFYCLVFVAHTALCGDMQVLVSRTQLKSLALTPLIRQSVTAWDHAADTDRTVRSWSLNSGYLCWDIFRVV